ncbi:MAG: YicC/YloC family endoribonuclease [Eubacteriales bacterium]
MAKSMTAYGRAQGVLGDGGKKITVELKSVNSRYFDPQIRISRAYSALEEKLKARVQSEISRGKIDISLFVEVLENTECEIRLDHAYTAGYLKALTDLRDTFGLADDISVMKVAQNKDIFTFITPEVSADQLWEEVLPFVDQALASFHAMRVAEGERLKADLMQKKANILALADQVSDLSRDCIEKYHDKFETRIRKLIGESGVEIDEQRILTECAIYADKVSIDEELVRLNSHFQSFDEIFESEEPIGRKLDFLVQEMNRETNTIGSKCSDASIAKIVVEIKSEIEKIREQIQNLE